jgi:hypothetical protein
MKAKLALLVVACIGLVVIGLRVLSAAYATLEACQRIGQ